MKNSKRLEEAFEFAISMATSSRLEFLTPELLLVGICCRTKEFIDLCDSYHVDYQKDIKEPIYAEMYQGNVVPEDIEDYDIMFSYHLILLMGDAEQHAVGAGRNEIDVPHILHAMLNLSDSQANYLMRHCFTEDVTELMRSIIDVYEGHTLPDHHPELSIDDEDDDMEDNGFTGLFDFEKKTKWQKLVTCVNDIIDKHTPLIGRTNELERTIQVLCRRGKNNPLHVGEPGVGKTALVYGLAKLIEDNKVPERLKGAKIYMLDMGGLVAGTQYRGEFEERIKNIMKGVAKKKNAIIYIDEIHTLIGSGATSGSSLDGSNILKPYLEAGDIRFIGSTTYKEYNKHIQQAQDIVRRFQTIDIAEPSIDETIKILNGLKSHYESFHNVKYNDDVMDYAVNMSVRYITDRFLPDKAIDLIDEAGAYLELHPAMRKVKGIPTPLKIQRVTRHIIDDTVKRICKLSDQALATTSDGNERLYNLADRIMNDIYGQDEAIRLSTEAVMMGKAGLLDADKPVASMLFVGPTGVGKTEVCKVLARELGIELVRFDMSEYTEKHTVAKLIGSPAGYVGYEDGGLLTDAIRKSPNCVLLLDEIEKAHSDIYNILLQVMDYARLTDNRGNKADFKNVILIMTSNAGAQYAAQASVGFGGNTTRGEAMLQTVKKTFKPEFLNRLSATVVFNDMDRHMASLILDKKLRQLCLRLSAKDVYMTLTPAAHQHLLDKGFTRQYGAREMDRVLQTTLSPMLMREILFGSLKHGGNITIDYAHGQLSINK